MAAQQPNPVPEREPVVPAREPDVPRPEPRVPEGEPPLPRPGTPPPVIEEGGLVDPRFLSPGPGDAVSEPGRLLEPGVGPAPPEGG